MNITRFLSIISLATMVTLTGCVKPVEPKVLVTASNNETMFVIPLQGENKVNQSKLDSADYYNNKKVSVKEVLIPHRWLQTGRWDVEGQWIPSVAVLKVDRSPVTVELVADDKSKAKSDKDAIWIESADSVGFTIGFSISALIEEQDTSVFLYRYPAGNLRAVIGTEVRARIQETAANFAARYSLDSLRSKKNEMLTAVKTDIVTFYKERGITITTLGMFGGMSYENPKIQEAIDKVFISQQEKETAKAALDAVADINKRTESLAQQDKANVITLATGKAEAVRLEAEAVASGNLLKSQADAKGIEVVSEATKLAASNPLFLKVRELDVQSRMIDRWGGSVPQIVVGQDSKSNLFMGLPSPMAGAITK